MGTWSLASCHRYGEAAYTVATCRYNTNRHVNAIGRQRPSHKSPVGPTINAAIDMRGQTGNPLDGFVIQEGAVPQALSRLMQTIVDVQPSGGRPEKKMVQRARKALARWKSRLLGPYVRGGAIQNTQIFLIMSHDGELPCAVQRGRTVY